MKTQACSNPSSEKGFSLIELSIVLLIAGLILVGLIQVYTIYDEKRKVERANALMTDVGQAFKNFPDRYIADSVGADAQGRLTGTYYARLPRPAPLNSSTAGNDYNQEVAAQIAAEVAMGTTDVSVLTAAIDDAVSDGDLLRIPGTGGANVLIGKLPAGTLGIRNDYMKDIHGRYVLYAVTEAATTDLNFSGAIEVIEEGIDHRAGSATEGQIIPYETHEYAQYVVVSMGENGSGAYAFDGSRIGACPDDDVREADNCNLDATGAEAIFRLSLLNEQGDNTTNDNYYDDTVIFENHVVPPSTGNESEGCEQQESMTIAGNTCPDGWERDDGFSASDFTPRIFNTDGGQSNHWQNRSKPYYNIDPETKNYYFTEVVTDNTKNEDIIGNDSVCNKKEDNTSTTKCFNKQVTLGKEYIAGSRTPGGGQNISGDNITEKTAVGNQGDCPDGWKVVSNSTRYLQLRDDRQSSSSYPIISVTCGQ